MSTETTWKAYTTEEIYNEFTGDSRLNEEFRAIVRARLDALQTAMINCVKSPEKMLVVQTYGDFYDEEWNRFVQLYQKYHN